MSQKVSKVVSFCSIAAAIVMMTAATVVERLYGSDVAFRYFYYSPLFFAFWAAAAVFGLIYLFSRKLKKRPATISLHLALVVILLGALVTHLSAESGQIHLRRSEPNSTLLTEDGGSKTLPFELTLDNFQIQYYPGSTAPSDYASSISLYDGKMARQIEISMNHIGKVNGWRLYQADYDPDLQGSILSASHDVAGTGITYAGYLLLLLSMLGFFIEKGSGFKAALRRIGATAVCLFALGAGASAKSLTYQPDVLPKDVADQFGRLYVYYNDRVAPLQTMARDYCLKAYGKSSLDNLSTEQVFTGWLFYYDSWKDIPLKIKAKERGGSGQAEKEYLLKAVATGEALKIFPLTAPGQDAEPKWFSCTDPLPDWIYDNHEQWLFVRKMLDVLSDSVKSRDWDEVRRLIGKIQLYQQKTAAAVLPSPRKTAAERLYNRIARPMVPFMATITLGIILFVLSGLLMARGKTPPKALQGAVAIYTALLLAYLTLTLALRWYVSGHAPFAGSYSMMMLMAWLSCIAVLLIYRRLPLVQPLGLLLAGFTMLMASISSANPQITHLMPVLQSPLLAVHVLSMMISYTLFGLVALNGIMGVLMPTARAKESLRDVSLVILCPGVFLLTFGTFLGAVWANISWGSYWAWDPKETWALATLLIYAAALHGGSIKAFRKPAFFHWWCIFAFVSVLITYFGVNLILGGMHSYA